MQTTLDLPAVHRAIQDLDEAGIVALASEAATTERGSWFATARAIGELQRRAGYRSAAVSKYASALKVSPATAYELGAIDKKILLPRLQADGDAAQFPIHEKRIYVTAYKLAADIKRPALEILRFAEQQRATNKRFSARKLREHFGVVTEKVNPIERSLAVLARLSGAEREKFVRGVGDPADILELAQRTADSVRALVSDLRGRGCTRVAS